MQLGLDGIEKAITGFLARNNNPLGFFILGLSACVEYIFPPFPGDMVTLFGTFLVTRYFWSLPGVFAVVLAGSALGSMVDFAVGIWMKERYATGRFLRGERSRAAVDRVIEAFRRHGEVYVALNRFLPAVRAVFFVAAGMAGMRAGRVLLFALVSAGAWNALLIGAGHLVGSNWEHIRSLVQLYTTAVWILLGAGAGALLLRWAVIRRRRAREERGQKGRT